MEDKNQWFEIIYKRNHKRIYDFIYKYSNNEEVALDLMQETFLNFYKSYNEVGFPEDKAMMLLYTIARNNSINYHKKFSTQKENQYDVDLYKSNKTSFEKEEELKDMELKLQQCLLELPEDQRTAIILKNMENMTLSQIAEIMGSSISTISRLVVKATARLLELAEKNAIMPY
ncbi:MAG: sigma-70 family RNA polymerase sigma factor [Leptospiraceae bacterium]|nr:sigma-70 family RNA polymerase sigma factor [Leptospiraceae bacterium]MCP5494698.1 sigma-70 family RNA polymerase sigma factor [Leptospiraceae bacterium]